MQTTVKQAWRSPWIAITLLSAAAPLSATVQWTLPGSPDAPLAIQGSPAGDRVCRVNHNGNVIVGHTVESTCLAATPEGAAKFAQFELAYGVGTWSQSQPPGVAAVNGGVLNSVTQQVCRVKSGNQFYIGGRLFGTNLCTYEASGTARTSPRYELLYPLNPSSTHLLTNSRTGRCARLSAISVSSFALMDTPCQSDPLMNFRLDSAGPNLWRIRQQSTGLCLVSDGQSTTTNRVLRLGTCGTPANLRLLPVGVERYRLQFQSNGQYITQGGAGAFGIYYSEGAVGTDDRTLFYLRTLADAARRLKVVSYNAMLLTASNFPGMRIHDRAKWIPPAIMRDQPDADVITISESFDPVGHSNLVDALNSFGYIHHSKRPTPGRPENGGVWIASRWPIEQIDTHVYSDCNVGSADCLAAKGASYARIFKLGRRYHVYVSHTQASSGSGNVEARQKQFNELMAFAHSHSASNSNEPVIITGDLNVDMEDATEYTGMVSRLRSIFFDAPRPIGVPTTPVAVRYTVDPAINQIEKERGEGHAKWLDYILNSELRLLPERADYVVRQYKHTEAFNINCGGGLIIGMPGTFSTRDLSDHGALVGSLVYPYGPHSTLDSQTVQVKFRVVDTSTGADLTGARILFDGEERTAPFGATLNKAGTYPVEVLDVPAQGATRWVFQSWRHGVTSKSFTIIGPQNSTDYTADIDKQHLVSLTTSPAAAGTVTGGGWIKHAAQTTLNAAANPGFRFVGFTGDLKDTRPSVPVLVTKPLTIGATFVATGPPALSVAAGTRTDAGNGRRNVQLILGNTAAFAALNARITGIPAIQTTSGVGAVTVVSTLPLSYGTVPPSGSVTNTLVFQWPATVNRTRMTVNFAADDGYTGTALVTVYR